MLSGSYIPSPLTVTWLSGNIPSPGKRAIILGINGLGNLAGVFSSLLFSPAFKPQMYRLPLGITLLSVCLALGGFLLLRSYILRVNIARAKLAAWHALEAEEHEDLSQREIWVRTLKHAPKWSIVGGAKWDCWVRQWIGCKLLRLSSEEAFTKRGDEEVTFEYEL
ncbi:hypothetical protein KEM55_005437 [Ascosphaera atra]|nr:hypothetical protein KEM55_005437 [Ascosphaera atra]